MLFIVVCSVLLCFRLCCVLRLCLLLLLIVVLDGFVCWQFCFLVDFDSVVVFDNLFRGCLLDYLVWCFNFDYCFCVDLIDYVVGQVVATCQLLFGC